VYKHPYGWTITETDNFWMTNLAMNLNPVHFNQTHAANTEFGDCLVNGTVVFSIAVGMSVIDVSMNVTANLRYDDMRYQAPVYHGDTIFVESGVIEKRESESRNHVGIIITELRAYNQRDKLVLSLERTPIALKREHASPSAARPPGRPEGVGT